MTEQDLLQAFDKSQYARPPPCDAGLDFKFRLSDDVSEASLTRDKPPGYNHLIHGLRELYFKQLRRSDSIGHSGKRSKPLFFHTAALDCTPLKTVSAASRGTLNEGADQIAEMLERDSRRRFEPRWYEVIPDAERDQAIGEVLADAEVENAWREILYLLAKDKSLVDEQKQLDLATDQELGDVAVQGLRASHDQDGAVAVAGQSASDVGDVQSATNMAFNLDSGKIEATAVTLKDKAVRYKEARLETALYSLTKSFRSKMREKLPALQAQQETGWGTCLSHGRYEVSNMNPLDLERNRPDLPVFSQLPASPGKAHTHWPYIVSFIGVKFSASEDVGPDETNQGFRYQRKIIQYHPMTTRSHHVTVCGDLVRLWSFTPSAYSTSKGYSLWKPEDRLEIGRFLALLTVAKPQSLLQQWLPPRRFTVDTPDHSVEEWEWLDGSFKLVHSRPEIWGSRTVMFAGRAKMVSPANQLPAERRARLDLQGSNAGKLTMIKCVFLPDRLERHELNMQHHLRNLSSTPDPIGLMQLDASAYETLTCSTPDQGKKSRPRRLRVIVFQHRFGQEIPASMSEKNLANIFSDVTQELFDYSDKGAHYRDLNDGNILYEDRDGRRPRAIICDHGNMRLGIKHRGTDWARSQLDSMESLQVVAQDDARSANVLFLPVSMSYVEEAMDKLKEMPPDPLDESPTASPQQNRAEVQQLDGPMAKDEAKYQTFLYSHSCIDDLESLCYVQVWHGLKRSFEEHRKRYTALRAILRDLKLKRLRWEDHTRWKILLSRFCPSMSSQWRRMMCELRDIIVSHQRLRRDRLTELVIGPLRAFADEERKAVSQLEDALNAAAQNHERCKAELEAFIVNEMPDSSAEEEQRFAERGEKHLLRAQEASAALSQSQDALTRRRRRYPKEFDLRLQNGLDALDLFHADDQLCFEKCGKVYERYIEGGLSDALFDEEKLFPMAGDYAENEMPEADWGLPSDDSQEARSALPGQGAAAAGGSAAQKRLLGRSGGQDAFVSTKKRMLDFLAKDAAEARARPGS